VAPDERGSGSIPEPDERNWLEPESNRCVISGKEYNKTGSRAISKTVPMGFQYKNA
jgi:hypothetical protein